MARRLRGSECLPASPPRPEPSLRAAVVGSLSSPEPPLVFLHGWPDDSRLWHTILPAFRHRRCVLLDLPRCNGHAWRSTELGLERLASLIMSELHKEGRPVVMIAHDWGAILASLVLAAQPELIDRLVLLDVGAQAPLTRWSLKMLLHRSAIASYQTMTALIYLLGRLRFCVRVADFLNKWWIRFLVELDAHGDRVEAYDRPTASCINYFYIQVPCFLCSKSYQRMNAALNAPRVPLLFLYGSLWFHDERWSQKLKSKECVLCDALHIRSNSQHWFFLNPVGADLTTAAISRWMECTQES